MLYFILRVTMPFFTSLVLINLTLGGFLLVFQFFSETSLAYKLYKRNQTLFNVCCYVLMWYILIEMLFPFSLSVLASLLCHSSHITSSGVQLVTCKILYLFYFTYTFWTMQSTPFQNVVMAFLQTLCLWLATLSSTVLEPTWMFHKHLNLRIFKNDVSPLFSPF